MNNKTLSIVSYITLIGWLIAYFSGKNNANNLLKYHLKQALGLFIIAFVVNIVLSILIITVPALSFLSYFSYIFLVLLVFGIINASNEAEKPLPLIGKFIENKFGFIK